MIKSLSPNYYSTPWISPLTGATATAYTINIYVWAGDINAVPASPQYSLTKQNIGQSVGIDKLNISRLVNDFLIFEPTLSLGLNPTLNQRWTYKEIIYTTANPSDDGVKQLTQRQLALKGYVYGYEGENGQPPTDYVYVNGREFKVNRSTIFSLPLQMGAGNLVIKSFPDNEINTIYDTNTSDTNNSSEIIKVLNINVSEATTDKYILISYNSVEIYVEIFDEYKYVPIDIYFINKEGEQQSLTFFKERKNSMTVTKETYENDAEQPSTGAHQYVDLNVQARTKFTASSGFVNENLNEEYKQLILSTRVYELRSGSLIPVNVSKKAIEYKTRVNNRLVNYVFDFKYSYNEINNI